MKKLPIGLQDFKKIRTENYLYVDKTSYIYNLTQSGTYYFLSRPRRFGKSLLVSTLKELFKGNRELFRELWIDKHWKWESIPVIHFSFNTIAYQELGLKDALNELLDLTAEKFSVSLRRKSIGTKFAELIQKVAAQTPRNKIAVLIDEYDKPIIEYIFKDTNKADRNRDIFKSFYAAVKDCDEFLDFFLLTGVSKFHKVSIFSDLNNLYDITRDKTYAFITGYNEEELKNYFTDHIEKVAIDLQLPPDQLIVKIRDWYNGYSWDAINSVYNPYSVLSFFKSATFENFWFSTGTPTFMKNIIDNNLHYELDGVQVGTQMFQTSSIEKLDYLSLLYQAGYLTIKNRSAENVFTLSFPNREVRESMYEHLLTDINDTLGAIKK